MIKHVRKIAILLAICVLLVGCAGNASTTTDNTKTSTDETIYIDVWTYYNGAQYTAFNDLVDEFNSTAGAEKGIVVTTSSKNSVNELEERVLEAAEGKVGAEDVPNIFMTYSDTAYIVNELGLVQDISEYFTEEELAMYVDSYIEEGYFEGESFKIFPVAKSTEILTINKTQWDVFAEATGASEDDLTTIEGIMAIAESYYNWTDSLTEEENDGQAFFGRDSMANYMLIGAMELGCEIFEVEDGEITLNFDYDVIRKLWDNYYVPFVKGYFAAEGSFRSDDVKTGTIAAYVGSSSSATYFPTTVYISDDESVDIEMMALEAPIFEGGASYAVQQGAGMVVATAPEEEIKASVEFLKWLTQIEQNTAFSVESGYMPVMKEANSMDVIREYVDEDEITTAVEEILEASVETINNHTMYTPKAFNGGRDARNILEYSMSDLAAADRATVVERLAEGMSLAEATADFVSDEYFDAWYADTLSQLKSCIE